MKVIRFFKAILNAYRSYRRYLIRRRLLELGPTLIELGRVDRKMHKRTENSFSVAPPKPGDLHGKS